MPRTETKSSLNAASFGTVTALRAGAGIPVRRTSKSVQGTVALRCFPLSECDACCRRRKRVGLLRRSVFVDRQGSTLNVSRTEVVRRRLNSENEGAHDKVAA